MRDGFVLDSERLTSKRFPFGLAPVTGDGGRPIEFLQTCWVRLGLSGTVEPGFAEVVETVVFFFGEGVEGEGKVGVSGSEESENGRLGFSYVEDEAVAEGIVVADVDRGERRSFDSSGAGALIEVVDSLFERFEEGDRDLVGVEGEPRWCSVSFSTGEWGASALSFAAAPSSGSSSLSELVAVEGASASMNESSSSVSVSAPVSPALRVGDEGGGLALPPSSRSAAGAAVGAALVGMFLRLPIAQ